MSENGSAPRRRRADRYNENVASSSASGAERSGAGTSYAVGNTSHGGTHFGEGQRPYASGAQWAVPPFSSGSQQPVSGSGGQDPWVSGAQDTTYTRWDSQPFNQAKTIADANGGAADWTPAIPVNPNRRRSHLALFLVPVIALVMIVGGVLLYVHLNASAEDNRIKSEAAERARALREKCAPYDNCFCPNVSVDGIDLAGMTADEARAAVHAAIDDKRWTISLVWQDGTPVTDAREQPIVITDETAGVTFDVEGALSAAWARGHTGSDEERAQDMAALADEPYAGVSAASEVDLTSIEATLNNLAGELYIEPQSAYFDEKTGFDATRTDPFTIQPEVVGRVLDTEGLREQIAELAHDGLSGEVVLTTRALQPAVTAAQLRAERFTLIGEAITPISTTSTEDRNNNIRRAYELINGKVIQPGRKFSFNDIVGQRTLANGFFPATEYVYGEHVEGVGGGVCQASSTIYVATVRANLRIISRRPHSLAVNYTPYGMDATVYWYDSQHKIDFSFSNNTDYPIYITAAVRQNPDNRRRLQCYVCIYGHALGDGVTYDLVTEETVLPAPEETEYRRDKNARYVTYKDEEYEYQAAADGMSVESWRVKYVNGVEESREHLYTDVYEPKQQIVYVGTRDRPVE